MIQSIRCVVYFVYFVYCVYLKLNVNPPLGVEGREGVMVLDEAPMIPRHLSLESKVIGPGLEGKEGKRLKRSLLRT